MFTLLDTLPRPLWVGLSWLAVGIVLMLSLLPVTVPEQFEFWNADKLVHITMYASLMLSFSRAYARQRWLTIAIALGGLGLGIECLQSLTPDRSASVLDEIANLTGISIMLALVRRAPVAAAPTSPVQP